jgi:xanthine dehydrogenase molybdopterin-binding subunit B
MKHDPPLRECRHHPPDSIGERTPLVDGIDKVSGRARYTADLPARAALVGRIGRSTVAHGLIRGIDTERRARALPGVHAVVTGEDFAAPYGVIPIAQNEWPLARGKVRYRGEPLFAVAADDEASAVAALAAVVVDIEELPACSPPKPRVPMAHRCCTTTSPATSSARSSRTSATSTPASPLPTWCWSAATTAPRLRTARSSSTAHWPSGSPSASSSRCIR